MLNDVVAIKSRSNKMLLAFWLCFIIPFVQLIDVVLSFNVLSKGIFTDQYHGGEFFAALSTILYDKTGLYPITIHGALDYIPGLIAVKIFGPNNYLFATGIFYNFLDFLSKIALIVLVFELIKKKPVSILLALGLTVAIMNFSGYRSLFLVLAIYLFFLIQNEYGLRTRLFLEICFGLVLAFGVFWSFNRGLAGVVSLGVAAVLHAYQTRRYLVSMGVFFISIISFGYISSYFSLENYIENIKILIDLADGYVYTGKDSAVFFKILIGVHCFLVAILLVWSVIKDKFQIEHLANSLMMIVLLLFMYKIVSDKADRVHFVSGMLGPVIAGAYFYSRIQIEKYYILQKITSGLMLAYFLLMSRYSWFIPFMGNHTVDITFPRELSVALILLGVFSFFQVFNRLMNTYKIYWLALGSVLVLGMSRFILILFGLYSGQYHWTDRFSTLPPNAESVMKGVRWASGELLESGTSCLFDFSSNGTINGLSGLPNCTRFSTLVYAAQSHEKEIIATIKKKKPKAVVYSSTHWAFRINNLSMHVKFPELNNLFLKEYTEEKCQHGLCVRYLTESNYSASE
ncbi:MAG: hypothetical protein HQL65_09920 [Magnetococcales bacterium]|nr:hypothetical protein [Magnetococcales bacterium]